MQYFHKSSSSPKNFAGKITLIVFWYVYGVLLSVFTPTDATITSALYVEMMKKLEGMYWKCSSWHAEDFPPLRQWDASHEHTDDCREIPPWLYCLGPPRMQSRIGYAWLPSIATLEKHMTRYHFLSDYKVKIAAVMWLHQDSQFYRDGRIKLPERWRKCVDRKSDCVE
jgi:hypothetical protein